MMLVLLAGPPLIVVGGLGDRRVTRQLRAENAPFLLPTARVMPADKKRVDDAVVQASSDRERAVTHE